MTLDERARRAAASVRDQAEQVETDVLLDRIRGTGRRPRWVVPAVAATAAAAVVILVVALVLPQLQVDRVEIAPDPVVPGDPEPSPDGTGTPDAHPGVGVWQRVTDDEVFGGQGDQEMRGIAARDGLTVAVGVDGEQAALWRNVGDVADPAAWERVAGDICGEASCEINDVAAGDPGFAAVGTLDGLPKVWRSPDGASWERIDLDVPNGGSERRLTVVTADGAGFVAFGTSSGEAGTDGTRPIVVVSRDGARWTEEPVEFAFSEAGADVVDAVGFEGRVLALTQVGDGAGILERGDDGTWRVRELGPEFGTDVVLRALTVEERGLLVVATRFLGAEEAEPAFWRSTDGTDWSSVDNGLRVAPVEQPHTAVSVGSTVAVVGEVGSGGGDVPPTPAFWLETEDGFQAMDGGAAFRDHGRMLDAVAVGDDRVVAVGEGGDLQDGDAVVWVYSVPADR